MSQIYNTRDPKGHNFGLIHFKTKPKIMKTLIQLSNGRRLMTLVLLTLLFSLIGCSKQEADPLGSSDALNDMTMKSLAVHEGTVNLEGFMRWYVYAKAEHSLIVDPAMMFTLCTAELTFTDKQNFTLHTRETIPLDPPVFFREMTFKGKMTPGGALKFTWPDTWMELNWGTGQLEIPPYANVVEQIRAHTGYILFGPGVNKGTVNYTGFFDGTKFFADCRVNAFQQEAGPEGTPYAGLVAGPIIFSMLTELQVVD